MMAKKVFAKTILTLGLAVAPLFGAAQPLFATATKPVNYCFMAKKLDGSSDYTACQTVPTDTQSISLAMGDKVRFAMRVGIENEVIDKLKYRVTFPLDQNPEWIAASVQPDALPQQPLAVDLNLPAGAYLQYVPGTTLYTVYANDQYYDFPREDISVNGVTVSPLYANGWGWYALYDIGDASDWHWSFMYFDMVVTGDAPEIPAPRMEFEATVANLTAGESLAQDRVATTVVSGDTVRIKYWLHNAEPDTLAEDVVLKVKNFARGTVTGSNFDPLTQTVTLTLEDGIVLKYVVNSARLYKGENDTAGRALSAAEVAALFGDGLKMGDEGLMLGCWPFQEWVEFDLKASAVKGDDDTDTPEDEEDEEEDEDDEEDEEMPDEEKPEVLAATGPEDAFLTAAFLAYLGFLVRKLRLSRYF
jgi:hypothetical protein